MTRNRLFGAVLILIIGASVVLGGMLGIVPKLDEIQAANAQREVVLAQNIQHEADLIVLKRDFAGIAELRTYLTTLQSGVPVDAGIPDFLDELEVIARQNSVTLDSLVISDAVAFQPAAELATESGGSAETGTGTDLAVASAVPAASTVLTAENYLAVTVSMTIAGAHSNLFDFVAGLQHGERSIAISTVATANGEGAIVNEMTVVGTIYVLLDPNGVTIGQ
ncbi:hypothetical protein E3T39_09270 [Cryobacterium suzukii]|uniref:Type II secretion system protein M n=1 Tax=Cryobacterium suzukii TaxID=1259198 RepID=A0A4R9AEK5_9MICO|nr:hypothetical protein [Cryobacterium suzukii]TFD59866.1 hypothetical protein E3T39_09270 [Cryobacterium suzukii]